MIFINITIVLRGVKRDEKFGSLINIFFFSFYLKMPKFTFTYFSSLFFFFLHGGICVEINKSYSDNNIFLKIKNNSKESKEKETLMFLIFLKLHYILTIFI